MTYVEGSFKTFIATAALAANVAVKMGTANNVVLATAATDVIIGVTEHSALAGGQVSVRLRSASGSLQIVAGGTVAINAAVTSNATGQGITTSTTGNQIIGYALEAGVTGRVIELMPSTAKF